MQISDMNLAFVESDSILDPMPPHSSMSAIVGVGLGSGLESGPSAGREDEEALELRLDR